MSGGCLGDARFQRNRANRPGSAGVRRRRRNSSGIARNVVPPARRVDVSRALGVRMRIELEPGPISILADLS